MPEEPRLNEKIRKALKKHHRSLSTAIMKLGDYGAFVRQHTCTDWQPSAQELASLTTLLDDQADVSLLILVAHS